MSAVWLDTFTPPWRRRSVLRGPASRSRPGIAFMELPECTIRYRVAGSGPRTIVFCADPPVVLELYDALVAELARDFRVVIFEMPAFGYSLPRPSLRLEAAPATAVVRAFLERLALGPYVLAFPCVPAYAALAIAGTAPALVDALVLMQAPDWHEELRWKDRRDPKGILARPVLGQLALRALRRKRAGDWYRLALARGSPLLAPFTRATQHAFDCGACFSLASAYQRFLVGPEPDFGRIAQPALVVWGEADRSHEGTDRESIRRYLPQARIVPMAGVGHFPELEAPQAFAAELRAFLG